MFKSKSLRLKTGCSFSSRMMMISPGSIPGSWSPSLENVIFWPSFIPLSTWTSRILRSLTVFFPWQVLHRSFSERKIKDWQILYLITEDPRAQGTGEVRMGNIVVAKLRNSQGMNDPLLDHCRMCPSQPSSGKIFKFWKLLTVKQQTDLTTLHLV